MLGQGPEGWIRLSRERWDERYRSGELPWNADPNQFLVEELGTLAPGRALDIACGRGRNAVWLACRGWSVTGVDFSRAGLDIARQLGAERGVEVNWLEADVVDWEAPREAFDLVVIAYLHLAVEQRRRVLAHAQAALAPGAVLFVVGHDLSNLTKGTGGPQDPAVLCGPEDVVGELSGLRIERADRVERTVEGEAGEATAIDFLVRAVLPGA